MKIKINDGCIGCGMCTTICPDVFRMNDEGLAVVMIENPIGFEKETADAKDSCPVQVIEINE
ncbi:ferredoxin [Anaerorhabdus sp.]|uniref:ferredoxin n=1 Tax=Anaerorhabdus sp. TaxID=1872524 RepID=UPI002FC75AA4